MMDHVVDVGAQSGRKPRRPWQPPVMMITLSAPPAA